MTPEREYGRPTPENPAYDFGAFIGRVKSLDREVIIACASAACESAESRSFGTGGPRARQEGSLTFAGRLKDLVSFLSSGCLPASMFSDRHYYKEIAEFLVAKGQLKKSVLDQFNS